MPRKREGHGSSHSKKGATTRWADRHGRGTVRHAQQMHLRGPQGPARVPQKSAEGTSRNAGTPCSTQRKQASKPCGEACLGRRRDTEGTSRDTEGSMRRSVGRNATGVPAWVVGTRWEARQGDLCDERGDEGRRTVSRIPENRGTPPATGRRKGARRDGTPPIRAPPPKGGGQGLKIPEDAQGIPRGADRGGCRGLSRRFDRPRASKI